MRRHFRGRWGARVKKRKEVRGFAIERTVIVGSPNARLSRFVAAALGVARSYGSDITVVTREGKPTPRGFWSP